MIVKCGDDLRQELLAYQLLLQFQVSTMVCMAGLSFTCGASNSETFKSRYLQSNYTKVFLRYGYVLSKRNK